SSLEWIVAGYALAYGLALGPAGRAGDRFGHKPLFLIGLTIFTLASLAFGVLGATIGVSTAIGPLLGGLIIAAAGARDGWRWVFLVNLFIGVVAVPLAAWLLPRPAARTRRGFDPVGLGLLTAALLLLLIPLVEGQQGGWPAWCWACLGGSAVAVVLLAAWE